MAEAIVETTRTFRAALAGGAIWLLALFIAFRAAVDPHSSNSATAQLLGRLASILGQTGVLLALFGTAVFLGTASQHVFRAPAVWVAKIALLAVWSVEFGLTLVIGKVRRRPVLRRFEGRSTVPVDLPRIIVAEVAGTLSPGEQRTLYDQVDRAIACALMDPVRDGKLVPALDEQAALRFNLVIPLLALTAAAGVKLGPVFWSLGVFPFVLAFQAAEYRALCNEELRRVAAPEVEQALHQVQGVGGP